MTTDTTARIEPTSSDAPGDGESGDRGGQTANGYHWKVFWTVGIALFAMVLDFSIVSLALSSIADEFEVTLRAVTWVAISTALVTSAIMLPLGRVSDITGRKKFHIAGMVFFVAGGLLAFTSQNLEMLITSRVVMSIGGAMGQAVVFAIVVGVFPEKERGKALGMITTMVAIGAASGPIIAGPVIQEFGWRAVFLVTAIPNTVGIVAAFIVLDDSRIGSAVKRIGTKYDWLGALSSAAALTVLILTISNPFAFDWGSVQIIGGFVVSFLLFAFMVWWELRIPDPMLNLRFFANSTFTWSTSTRFLAFMGGTATFFLMPIFVQSFMGYDQRSAGMIMFIGALGMGLSSQLSGRLSDRYGFRIFTFVGIGLLVVTNIGFSFFVSDTPLWIVMPVLFVNGVAMGLWMAPNMSATLSTVSRSDLGSMSAFLNLVRNVGSVLGQAIVIAIIAGTMLSRGAEVELNELADAGEKVSQAFLAGWSMAFRILAAVTAVALFAAFRTKVYTKAQK
ncbi:MAG: MFS transporter [Dehalococcoidia bacterium]